jgi:hypothetical protein
MAGVRLFAGDARSAEPTRGLDVLLVSHAPKRFRWRTPCASLAAAFGLFYVAGGKPSRGTMIAAGHRVTVQDRWCVPGAALARLVAGDDRFTVAVGASSPELSGTLSDVDGPLVSLVDGTLTTAGFAEPVESIATRGGTILVLPVSP